VFVGRKYFSLNLTWKILLDPHEGTKTKSTTGEREPRKKTQKKVKRIR
jgi:hypothetical protein